MRAALSALTLAAGIAVVGASPAAAVPGVPDCKSSPVVASPNGMPLANWLDTDAGKGVPSGAPFANPADPTIYYNYGYAGLSWSTYDLGCGGAFSSTDSLTATVDTFSANQMMGISVAGTALTNGLHAKLGNPTAFLSPLDDVVTDVVTSLRGALYKPWAGVALAVVAAMMLGLASAGRLSATVQAGGWALAVLTISVGVLNYPLQSAHFFDQTVSASISTVNAAAAGVDPPTNGGSVTQTQGAQLVDKVLYDSWVRGEFGTTTGPAVDKYAATLWQAHTMTYAEANTAAKGGDAAKLMIEKKQSDWSDTMDEIRDSDPSLYERVQGKAGGRSGVAFMSVLATAATGFFRVIADLYTLVGMLMIRLIVMFVPVIGVLGMIGPLGGIVRMAGNAVGAAVINTIAFSLAAAIHTVSINALLNGSGGGLEFGRLILAGVLSAVLLLASWPLLSLRRIVGSDHRPGASLLGKVGKMARSYATTRSATRAGVEAAVENTTDDSGANEPGADGRYRWSSANTRDTIRPEGLSRPVVHPTVDQHDLPAARTPLALSAAPVTAGTADGAPAAIPLGAGSTPTPRAAITTTSTQGASSSTSSSSTGSAATSTGERVDVGQVRPGDVEAREQERARTSDVYRPAGSSTAASPALDGRVLPRKERLPEGIVTLPPRPLHESNERPGDEPGKVYAWDPDTGRDVVIGRAVPAAAEAASSSRDEA